MVVKFSLHLDALLGFEEVPVSKRSKGGRPRRGTFYKKQNQLKSSSKKDLLFNIEGMTDYARNFL